MCVYIYIDRLTRLKKELACAGEARAGEGAPLRHVGRELEDPSVRISRQALECGGKRPVQLGDSHWEQHSEAEPEEEEQGAARAED